MHTGRHLQYLLLSAFHVCRCSVSIIHIQLATDPAPWFNCTWCPENLRLKGIALIFTLRSTHHSPPCTGKTRLPVMANSGRSESEGEIHGRGLIGPRVYGFSRRSVAPFTSFLRKKLPSLRTNLPRPLFLLSPHPFFSTISS